MNSEERGYVRINKQRLNELWKTRPDAIFTSEEYMAACEIADWQGVNHQLVMFARRFIQHYRKQGIPFYVVRAFVPGDPEFQGQRIEFQPLTDLPRSNKAMLVLHRTARELAHRFKLSVEPDPFRSLAWQYRAGKPVRKMPKKLGE